MRQPRPNRYRDTWAGTLDAGRVEDPVRVAGRVHRRRDHGGVVFIDLRDGSGIAQLVFHPDRREAHGVAHRLRPEDVVSATGRVVARAPENVNPALPTGEVEVAVSEAELLVDAETPPFPVDEDGPVDELLRLRHRSVDLRRTSMREAIVLRHRMVAAMRAHLVERDFLEIETPTLTRSTPEGARDFLVPARGAPGSVFALPQSPQLFKQLLMMGGFERYFQIARCYRDEDSRADRQPEFTQLDLEMSFVEEEDVIELVEGLMSDVLAAGGLELPAPPWPRLPYHEAMLRYGTDRPDTRFGLEIADVSELVRGSEFKVFESVLGAGGVVRALNAGPLPLSRAEQEALNEIVRPHGARAVAPVYAAAEGWDSNLAKFFTAEQITKVNERLAASAGDLLLFVADREPFAAAALGALRLELARRGELIPAGGHCITWVVDFPMFGYDEEEGRFDALHHPFTSPAGALTDPATARSRAYDLVLDGVEIGGGSIRIHDPAVQREVFRALGISDGEAEQRFGFLLDALRYGAPPHGGIAFGVDRIVALAAGRDSIRDVIAFPKTASGADPLTGAPAPVAEGQLRELGLRTLASSPRPSS